LSALVISGLVFGLLHVANPNATLLAGLAIAIEAGILLGGVYMLTRRLWLAMGLHLAWNLTQGGVYGVAVSGHAMDGLLESALSGPAWLSGGAFGAEASVPWWCAWPPAPACSGGCGSGAGGWCRFGHGE
jgi:uncharacterized protein